MCRHFRGFLAFGLVIGCAVSLLAQAPPASGIKPGVSGTFKGNGKEAKLAFVSAQWREPFGDKPAVRLIFSEKDHTRDAKADFNAGFGRYGSALIVSLHEDGGIFGCEVAHSALRGTFSAIGTIKAKDFKIDKGQVQGQLSTGGPDKVFSDTWEVELTFTAPLSGSPILPAAASAAPSSDSRPPATADRPAAKKAKAADAPSASAPAAPALNVKELPIPADATGMEYKKLVQHIGFKSPGDYKAVAADLVKKLTAQGWKIDGADRVTATPKIPPKSYILNCKRGGATLTVFVKPADAGSEVTIFSSGLVWD